MIVVCAPALVLTMMNLMRHPTLLVDEDRQRLVFTPGWPWPQVELAFSEVSDGRVTPLTTTLKNGSTATVCYKVVLTHTASGAPRDLTVCDYFHPEDAGVLVAWLRNRFGVGVPVEPPVS